MKKIAWFALVFVVGVAAGFAFDEYMTARSQKMLALSALSVADQHLKAGDFRKAVEFSVISIKFNPGNYYPYIVLAESYKGINKNQTAKAYYQKALDVLEMQDDVTEIGRRIETEKLRKIISGIQSN